MLRAEAYSPNNVGNDAAIFNAVAELLRAQGCEVTVYPEEEFLARKIEEEIILNMCREHSSIIKLQRLEREGRLVINSGFGIENCSRERMTTLLLGNGVPYPDSLIVSTADDASGALMKQGFGEVWVKRGDSYATHKEDVCYCHTPREVLQVMEGFSDRGIERAVINTHLEGDLVKFYGVRGQEWFYWFYPLDKGHSKYGNEEINGKARGLSFDVEALKTICQRVSEILDVRIFGGDCIVAHDGTVRIIDFNDWPSFAPCREEAAQHIAECVMKCIGKRENQKL